MLTRHAKSFTPILAAVAMAILVAPGWAADGSGKLDWRQDTGTVWTSPVGEVALDRGEELAAPVLRLIPGGEYPISTPKVHRVSDGVLELSYNLALPGSIALEILRRIEIEPCVGGVAAVEDWTLAPSRPINVDCELERPFVLRRAGRQAEAKAILPLKNGWAKTVSLGSPVRCEYRLGHALSGKGIPDLALPVVGIDAGPGLVAAVMMDPTFSTLVELFRPARKPPTAPILGTVRYRYRGSRVPLAGRESRRFAIWIASGATAGLPGSAGATAAQADGGVRPTTTDRVLDAFFALMLPDVPPGPKWLHEIAMIDYDYLSDNGQGWDRDVRLLASWLKPEERRRVALCLHGWYDALGPYCFDAATGQMKKEWVAFQPTRKVRLTQDEMRRRLRVARDLGFRALLYFGDGMASDSGVPSYRDEWAYRDAQGQKIGGWQGPDTLGKTYMLNPAHPEVFRWYLAYVDALLKTYGADFDGLVWDETFHARLGQIASKPVPAYCDRAMMALVKEISRRVHAFDPQKVFLASDCIGIPGFEDVPGYGMVAHGTWQDSWCYPTAWSYGLLPNYRNVLWSCNWSPVNNYHFTRWAVETFGVPVSISNGWGDDLGPSEWKPSQKDVILRLFRERLQQNQRVRYLTTDPAGVVARGPHVPTPGDPLPAPAPGTVNWALASQGSRATASSEEAPKYPAKGAINGVRDDAGWGGGHGWVSADGAELPQWLQVDFGQTRSVSRIVVITYEHDKSMETAGKWGVLDYEVQASDPAAREWRTLVTENKGRAAKVRVHTLEHPVPTEKIRLVVRRVAPLDGRVRLLQLEAWGR